jgi:hypothetical protein
MRRAEIKITYDFGTKTFLEDGIPWGGVKLEPGRNTVFAPGGPCIPKQNVTWNPSGYLIWTKKGVDGSIKAEIDPDNIISESNETNNIKFTDTPVTVAEAPLFKVLFIPAVLPGEEDWTFSRTKINNQMQFIRDIYPLGSSDLFFTTGTPWSISTSYHSGWEFRDWLFEIIAYPISCTTRMMGYNRVVIGLLDLRIALGIAIGILREPALREPVLVDYSLPNDDLVAHELGHTYYLWHPHDLGPHVYSSKRYHVRKQQYFDRKDVFMSYREFPTWIDSGRYEFDLKIPLPAGRYYCPGDPKIGKDPYYTTLPVDTWQWNLLDQLTETPSTYACIMVHGILNNNNTITLNHSWYDIEAVPDTPNQIRNDTQDIYYIILRNDNNQILSTFPFPVSFTYAVHNDKKGDLENITTDKIPFIFNIQKIPGTRHIHIEDANGNILAARTITQNIPEVQITTPNGGEQYKTGEKITIEWTAIDKDQDPLRYTLAFKNENDEIWVPMSFDIRDESYEWNTYGLEAGSYKIKVIASDGVNSGEDITDGSITLPKNKLQDFKFKLIDRLFERFPLLQKVLNSLRLNCKY